MPPSVTAAAVHRFEDLLLQQQSLALEVQTQLHTLRQCNDRLEAELREMQKAHTATDSEPIGGTGDSCSQNPAPAQLQKPGTASSRGGAGDANDHPKTLRPDSVSEKQRAEDVPNAAKRTGRVLELARNIEMDFVFNESTEIAAPLSETGAPTCSSRFRFVNTPQFDMVIGAVIVANTIVMSAQLEVEGWAIKPGSCDGQDCASEVSKTAFLALENIFTFVFALELILRLLGQGMGYLKAPANLGDCIIVLISSLDSWVLTPLGSKALSNVAVLRLLRLVRLAKVLRVVRVMKAFTSLRVIVSAVVASVGALAWSMTLLFVLILMFSILMAQLVRASIEDASRDMDSRTWLWDKFGTWYNAMLTVFEITMAPGGFINYRRLNSDVSPVMGIIVAAYVCSVTFAVVRVITAMFLKATLSASDKDEATMIEQKTKKLEAYFKTLHDTLEGSTDGGDPDEAGLIDEADLTELLSGPGMTEWFSLVGLNSADAIRLHRSMAMGTGVVKLRELVTVLLRMRGGARACELIVLLYETRAMSDRLACVEREVDIVGKASRGDLAPSRLAPSRLDLKPGPVLESGPGSSSGQKDIIRVCSYA